MNCPSDKKFSLNNQEEKNKRDNLMRTVNTMVVCFCYFWLVSTILILFGMKFYFVNLRHLKLIQWYYLFFHLQYINWNTIGKLMYKIFISLILH